MMKINGWKRIGIIASVIWVIGAWVTAVIVLGDQDLKRHAFYYGECAKIRDEMDQSARVECERKAGLSDTATAFNDCMEAYRQKHRDTCGTPTQDIEREGSEEREMATFLAFVPVPFAWGFVYLVIFLVRWVKRGFTGARP
jgi:hypothetical protein